MTVAQTRYVAQNAIEPRREPRLDRIGITAALVCGKGFCIPLLSHPRGPNKGVLSL